ncbi:MAG TPA: sulfatase-like hydrolase/transferase [Thermoanaerobaculia bacterium]|nr:sulfatase-like hydrolase/transferase [Thermoanaerobaculia bacterium]
MRKRALLLFVLCLFPLAGCRRGGAGGGGAYPGAPIVIISIDTLRSDHLPAYGYRGVETPAIDALRRDAILYERAYSHIPLTLPSHASILTGLLPAEHGVRDNVGYVLHADKVPHLPRSLKGAGYATGAAVSAYVLRPETGMAADFDFYEGSIDVKASESLGRSQRPGRETTALAEKWMHSVDGKPFFLLLHLYEPHTPYEPPEPFLSRYRNPYDGEIAAADAIVGDFLADLKSRGTYDKAIVVLLSDHGEGLLEHGEQEHGILLYREALQVPLLLKLPSSRRAGESVAAPAQLIDIFPTLVSLVGLEVPKALKGASLLDLEKEPARPPRAIYSETYYPRLHLGWSELTSLIQDRFHYIQAPDPELYDLPRDPGERTNALPAERRAYAALRDRLKAFLTPLAAPSAVDDETAQKLASLGYLGASVKASGPLPDPKSRISTLKDFGLALHAYQEQKFAEAVPVFERLVAANPQMVDAWEYLGQALQALGRRDEALAALEKAMTTSGGVSHVALATASLLIEMNRLDEAKKHAELGLATSPASAHSLLAQIAIARKDPDEAERQAKAALAARGSRIGPLLTMAQVQRERGQLAEALATTQQAVDELGRMEGRKRFAGLFFVRGDVLGRLGRTPEAEQCFLREIADFPADTKSYSRLAVLYASEGRPDEAIATLQRLIASTGSPAAYAEAVKTLRVLGDPAQAKDLLRHALALHPDNRELKALGG